MILSDEQIEERLSSPDNIVNMLDGQEDNPASGSLQVNRKDETRGHHGPRIPDLIRKLIAQTSNAGDESLESVASVFSVSTPTVSNYSRGLVHTRLDTELQELANKTAQEKTIKAHDLALDSLVGSLNLVKDKLDTITTAKEAVRVAEGMARVVEKLKSKDDDESKIKTLVVVTMPIQRKEGHYETIDV